MVDVNLKLLRSQVEWSSLGDAFFFMLSKCKYTNNHVSPTGGAAF